MGDVGLHARGCARWSGDVSSTSMRRLRAGFYLVWRVDMPQTGCIYLGSVVHILGQSVFSEPTGCSERKWVGRAEVTIPWFLASLCPGAEPISRSIGWRSYIGGTGRHPIGKGLFPKLKPLVVHTEDRPCSMPITSTASSWSILGHSISAGQLLA